MNIDIYSTQGKKAGTATLSDAVFNAAWNPDLVHQAVTVFAGNLRQGSAHTKDRGAVSGGGKKPWKQKGTGQARHGSKRSPIWRHGGITFGPLNSKVYTRSLTKSMKVVSLCSALSQKLRDDQILFVDALDNSLQKTKAIASQFKNLTTIDGFGTLCTLHNSSNVLLVGPKYDAALLRSIKNLPYVTLTDAENLNTYQVANTRYIVIINPEAVNAILLARREGTVGSKKSSSDTDSPKKAPSKRASAKKVATK